MFCLYALTAALFGRRRSDAAAANWRCAVNILRDIQAKGPLAPTDQKHAYPLGSDNEAETAARSTR
jgi:hypothetical protein